MRYLKDQIIEEIIRKTHRKKITLFELNAVLDKLGLPFVSDIQLYSEIEKTAVVLYFQLKGTQKNLADTRRKLVLERDKTAYQKEQAEFANVTMGYLRDSLNLKLERILTAVVKDNLDCVDYPDLPADPNFGSNFTVEPDLDEKSGLHKSVPKDNQKSSVTPEEFWSSIPAALRPQNINLDHKDVKK